jgi:hypothetical protein
VCSYRFFLQVSVRTLGSRSSRRVQNEGAAIDHCESSWWLELNCVLIVKSYPKPALNPFLSRTLLPTFILILILPYSTPTLILTPDHYSYPNSYSNPYSNPSPYSYSNSYSNFNSLNRGRFLVPIKRRIAFQRVRIIRSQILQGLQYLFRDNRRSDT